MTSPDISIVLTAHREGPLLSPTLRSLVDTTLHAGAKGLSVELVAVLDSPDEATRAVLRGFDSVSFVRIERIEVAYRSPGPSRNAGLAAARGAFTATVDGDDLYSFAYLAAMHAAATSGGLVVAQPALCVWFDADWLVQRFEPLARTGRFRLAGAHTYMSCLLAPTAFLRDLGYRDCIGGRAFAYEDYDLTCRAVAAGADIHTAEDAALFYRRRAGSIMAGIADAHRLTPPSAFFDPVAFAAADDGDEVVADGETLRAGLLALRGSHVLAELVAHASAIEPRIELAKLRDAPVWTNAMFDRGFGAAYHALCGSLGAARFDAVLVVDAFAPTPLRPLVETARRWLVIETAATAPVALGEGCRAVALGAFGAALPPERRAEMIVRLVHAFAARACLHLVLGGECAVFAAFAEAFERNPVVVYRLAGVEAALAPDAAIDCIVSDDVESLDALVARMPVFADKVATLPAMTSAAEAEAWLATLDARLAPRPEETRWTSL